MSTRRSLDVIEVKKPCTADWSQMKGDEQRRFCSHCNKFVHNLSALPADEAERLICQSAGSMCVRFSPATLNYASKAQPSRRRAIATIGSILAAVCCAGGWTTFKLLQKKPAPPVQTPMIMGEILCPPVQPTPPSK